MLFLMVQGVFNSGRGNLMEVARTEKTTKSLESRANTHTERAHFLWPKTWYYIVNPEEAVLCFDRYYKVQPLHRAQVCFPTETVQTEDKCTQVTVGVLNKTFIKSAFTKSLHQNGTEITHFSPFFDHQSYFVANNSLIKLMSLWFLPHNVFTKYSIGRY